MHFYQDILRENNYLKACLNLEGFVYAVCIGASSTQVRALGCVKFLNGIDHYKNRDKMFKNINCERYWVLVDEDVYSNFKNGDNTFLVR